MSTFTPGPWEVCGVAVRTPIVVEDGRHTSGGVEVARAAIWWEEAAGNAALIAEAPALYADLTDAIDYLRQVAGMHEDRGETKSATLIRGAIDRYSATLARASRERGR